MPGIFDVLAARGILNSIFGGQPDTQAQANANQQSMMDILAGRAPVPRRGNDATLMASATPPALAAPRAGQDAVADMEASSAATPTPMIIQAMQNGGVPVGNASSFLPPDAEREMAQAEIDPRTIPSARDPFTNTYNAAATAFQNAQGQAAGLADTLGLKFDRPLARLAMGLGAAGSQDPLGTLMKLRANEEEIRAAQSERNRTKVTPLADGAFSLVQRPGQAPQIVRNDEVAKYLGDVQQSKFEQALQKVVLGGQVNANTNAAKAAIRAGEDARPLLNDVTGMIDRWGQAKTIIEGQGVGAQIQGAFPGIAGFFGGDQVAANKFLEGLTVDETLLNTARTKGAISNQEMNLFKAPIPSTTDDREKVWKPWIEKRLEVLNKLKTFYEGEVARGTAAGNQPLSNQPAPAPAPAAASGGPTKITSEAEWASLPSGTQYIGPDGKTRTKR